MIRFLRLFWQAIQLGMDRAERNMKADGRIIDYHQLKEEAAEYADSGIQLNYLHGFILSAFDHLDDE